MLCQDNSKGGCSTMNFLIVGGDDRLVELANILSRNGSSVYTYGLEKAANCKAESLSSLEEAVAKCDVIIGPIPFAKDIDKLNTSYAAEPIEIDRLFRKIPPDKKLFFGALNKKARELAEKYAIHYTDYYQDESYQILNTIPTAEGAIALMVSETDRTVYDCNVLILGYGRIGKVLSEYAKAMGAKVHVEARKEEDLAWIKARGMKAVPLDTLEQALGEMDIIVNTVPALVLDAARLALVKDDVFLLDLASLPGGIDYLYAKEKGLKAIHALGIPGKIAAKSAAEYIYDTINKLLKVD